jgi:hypothetical protein
MSRNSVVIGVIVLVCCSSGVPVFAGVSFGASIELRAGSTMGSSADLPTWYQGDVWTYSINPLYFSSPNGSFSGSIQNFKQQVVGIVGDAYKVTITGTITGSLVISGYSGTVAGTITGTSYMRVSDLAEESSAIQSQGTIIVNYVPLPYDLNLVTESSPALELFDFPVLIDEQWLLQTTTTTSGLFSIVGFYEQSLNGSQYIDETVSCTGEESIIVPAGDFLCLTVARGSTTTWYSSEAGNIVKSVIDESAENVTVQMTQSLQSFSRVVQPLAVTMDLNPSVAAPGAMVTVSGVVTNTGSGNPVQNGTVSVTIPSTGGSWSTTTDSSGQYMLSFIAPTMLDDTPSSFPRETGSGGVMVSCTGDCFSGYRVQTLTTVTDTAPLAPEIQGSTEGKVGTPIPYSFVFQDPENDNLSYYINWGDGENTSWVGPDNIGDLVVDHIYTKRGTYTITAKTMDVYGLESPAGTLQVKMPVDVSSPLLHLFFERFPHAFPLLRHLLGC